MLSLNRVVIVEDNDLMRGLLRTVLGVCGTKTILEATNGLEALAFLMDGDIDLVIMDWQMDVMDGLECTRQIRAGKAGLHQRDVPILLLTGNVEPGAEAEALAAGVSVFSMKPFNMSRLTTWIQQAMAE